MMIRRHTLISRFWVAMLAAVLLTGPAVAATTDRHKTPRRVGEMVDVGGWQLHLKRAGHGGPTVVVEAGSGDFSFDWDLVAGPVSRFTSICTYDRAGYAWSDPGPTPRTFRQLAWELHTAL